MKLKNQLKYLTILLLIPISVSANNSLYQDLPEFLKGISFSKCKANSKTLFDSNGKEIAKFNLPKNKINRALRNNKRLYLYNSGIVKNYSYETTENLGYPYIINCHI